MSDITGVSPNRNGIAMLPVAWKAHSVPVPGTTLLACVCEHEVPQTRNSPQKVKYEAQGKFWPQMQNVITYQIRKFSVGLYPPC